MIPLFAMDLIGISLLQLEIKFPIVSKDFDVIFEFF